MLAEAGGEAGGLARQELDAPVRAVEALGEARGRPRVAEDLLLQDPRARARTGGWKLAQGLHDKVLFADAEMDRADRLTRRPRRRA